LPIKDSTKDSEGTNQEQEHEHEQELGEEGGPLPLN